MFDEISQKSRDTKINICIGFFATDYKNQKPITTIQVNDIFFLGVELAIIVHIYHCPNNVNKIPTLHLKCPVKGSLL
jgi:hypothetical protein